MAKKIFQTMTRIYMVLMVPVSLIYVLFCGYPPVWSAPIVLAPILIDLVMGLKEIV